MVNRVLFFPALLHHWRHNNPKPERGQVPGEARTDFSTSYQRCAVPTRSGSGRNSRRFDQARDTARGGWKMEEQGGAGTSSVS